MFRYLTILSVCSLAISTVAQASALTAECQEAVRAGENVRNLTIYTTCGFDDKKTAFGEWSIWAEKEKAGQALYEICARHQGNALAERYCQKAAELGNGSALLHMANQLYKKNDYQGAASLYTRALNSPLLTDAEKGDIAQNMGLLYMNPSSSYYNPQKGMPLIERAVQRRGAAANNLMGVYSLFGLQNVPQDAEKSFQYLWRAILLGCPAAEENLGLWHLAKQKKIDTQRARQEMTERSFSCNPTLDEDQPETQKHNCDCVEVAERERMAKQSPYRLIAISQDTQQITLLDKNGQEINAKIGTQLPNGMKVTEIRAKAAFLTALSQRSVLNLAPIDDCPTLCQDQLKHSQKAIKPYHLTFTPRECADILYYAERLVDTSLPFTGKIECGFSADMDKTTDLLMKL